MSGPVKYKDHPGAVPGVNCELCGNTPAKPVRDHCHEHDWVRGIICPSCNVRMRYIDRRIAPRVGPRVLAALVAFWHRCPDCGTLDVADIAPAAADWIAAEMPDDLYDGLCPKRFTVVLDETDYAALRALAYEDEVQVAAKARDLILAGLVEASGKGQQ